MDFTFVHAADLHLDTPFQGMARLSPEVAEVLREASLEAFDDLVRLAIRVDAAFLLLAGDIYDGEERGIRAQLRFLHGLRRLSRRGIRVFVVHGNHDPVGGWSAVREWPEGVTVFPPGEVQRIPVERDGQRLALVHGISYGRRHETENLALRFRRDPGPGLQVGLLHCHLGSDPAHAPYSPCRQEDLLESGLDYWALGHLHRRHLPAEGGPWIAYPGNLQGRSLTPTESGAKGALVVDASEHGVRSTRFEPLDRVRFVDDNVPIEGIEDLAGLADTLAGRGDDLRRQHLGRHLVLRITLTGRGPLHTLLQRREVIDGLLDDLRRDERPRTPLLWWEGLRDRTRSRRDLEHLEQRDDFIAALARLGRRLGGDADALRSFFETHAAAPAHGLDRLVTPPGDRELADLLDRALDRALDRLEEER